VTCRSSSPPGMLTAQRPRLGGRPSLVTGPSPGLLALHGLRVPEALASRGPGRAYKGILVVRGRTRSRTGDEGHATVGIALVLRLLIVRGPRHQQSGVCGECARCPQAAHCDLQRCRGRPDPLLDSKERVVPVPPALMAVLEHYITTIRPALPHSKFLFVNPNSARTRKFNGRYGARSVAHLVLAAGTGAGISGRHFPHRWRHSYATSLLRRGTDIHVVQRLLGHSNIATTTRYLHLSDTDLADAVDRAFPES